MTNEQINKCIRELKETISDAQDEIKTLHGLMKKNSPIQVGDRVRITTAAYKNPWSDKYTPESNKEAECVELTIEDIWHIDGTYQDEVVPVYCPITKAGVVAKLGKFTASTIDKVEKI